MGMGNNLPILQYKYEVFKMSKKTKKTVKVTIIQVLPETGLITVKHLGKYIGATSAEQTVLMLPDGVKIAIIGALSSSLIDIKELKKVANLKTVKEIINEIKSAIPVPTQVEETIEPVVTPEVVTPEVKKEVILQVTPTVVSKTV